MSDRLFERFDPAEYLKHYYSVPEINDDERQTYEWIIGLGLPHVARLLEVGCGPTLHNVLPFATIVSEIHMADVLPGNLEQVRRWIDNDPQAHDWGVYVRAVLELEGRDSSEEMVNLRMAELRRKITDLKHVDLSRSDPLGEDRTIYPLVTAFYCVAGATANKGEWTRFMNNLATLVEPGGTLLLSDFVGTDTYRVGDEVFANARLDEEDMRLVLRDNPIIDSESIAIESRKFRGWEAEGLSRFMLVMAKRRAQ